MDPHRAGPAERGSAASRGISPHPNRFTSSNGGTTSQDLKTGFLVGATPSKQQIAILVGSLASAIALGPILMQLNETATVYVPRISREPVAGPGGTSVWMRDVENFPADLRVDPASLSATTVILSRQLP